MKYKYKLNIKRAPG